MSIRGRYFLTFLQGWRKAGGGEKFSRKYEEGVKNMIIYNKGGEKIMHIYQIYWRMGSQ